MNELSQRLRDHRGKDTSAQLMADALGISVSFYQKLERGTRLPKRPQDIAAIADVLGVDTDAIYGYVGVCPPDLIDHLASHPKHVKQVRSMLGI